MKKKCSGYAAAAFGLWLASAAGSVVAAGKIYTCEVNGVVVYTSRPSGSCHSTDLPTIGRYSSSRYDAPQTVEQEPRQQMSRAVKKSRLRERQTVLPSKAPVSAVRRAPEPSYTPKPPVSNSRRAILETELANERRALADAQKSLAQARAAKSGLIDRQQINQMEGSVLERQQNIQALQRELGRM